MAASKGLQHPDASIEGDSIRLRRQMKPTKISGETNVWANFEEIRDFLRLIQIRGRNCLPFENSAKNHEGQTQTTMKKWDHNKEMVGFYGLGAEAKFLTVLHFIKSNTKKI